MKFPSFILSSSSCLFAVASGANVWGDTPNAGSDPRDLTPAFGRVYFSADAGDGNGRQLWATDGFQQGHEVWNTEVSDPRDFTWFSVTEDLWFSALESKAIPELDQSGNPVQKGRELFSSVESKDSPHLRSDINPGAPSSDPSGFIEWDGKLFFAADDGTHGRELWITDQYDSGAKLWTDIAPGDASSDPQDFVVFHDVLYFTADDGVNGRQIWKNDGTMSGSTLYWNLGPDANPSNLVVMPAKPGIMNETLFFAATNPETGRELYFINNTFINPGPQLYADINPGAASSDPSELTVTPNGYLVLSAALPDGFNDHVGREIWVTDGNYDDDLEGTRLVVANAEIVEGGSNPTCLFWFNGTQQLYFGATRFASKGAELFSLDVQTKEVQEYNEINPGPASSNPCEFVENPMDGSLLFVADDGVHGRELFNNRGYNGNELWTDINQEPTDASVGTRQSVWLWGNSLVVVLVAAGSAMML